MMAIDCAFKPHIGYIVVLLETRLYCNPPAYGQNACASNAIISETRLSTALF